MERRRLQEAEEWRLQQLRSGASDENPNLQVRQQIESQSLSVRGVFGTHWDLGKDLHDGPVHNHHTCALGSLRYVSTSDFS